MNQMDVIGSLLKTTQIKKINLILIGLLLSNFSMAQQAPISKEVEGMVNLFTGDFNYSVPLLSVNGPNGEAFPLNLHYTGGIKTDQPASWVGLGWDLPLGEISRSVNGVADDYSNKAVNYLEFIKDPNNTSLYTVKYEKYANQYYGPVYFYQVGYGDINQNAQDGEPLKTLDIYQSDRAITPGASAFEFPDYDNYSVSGPAIANEMQPNLFRFGTLLHKNENGVDFSNAGLDALNRPTNFNRRAEFHMKDEPRAQVKAPFYGFPNYLALDTINHVALFKTPADIIDANLNALYSFSGDFNSSTKRKKGGHFIDYFTNSGINNFDPTDPLNNQNQRGFLDYVDRSPGNGNRNPSEFDPDGIGAFQVTLPNGLIYHYSLPEYTVSEEAYSFPLTDNYTKHAIPNWEEASLQQKNEAYATSWKLTAITGPDFEDVNQNGKADLGDKGYWIAVNYQLWNHDHKWRSPYYGYHVDLKTHYLSENYEYNEGKDAYSVEGNVLKGITQVYYVNSIQTSTQTALFLKEVRLDGHSTDLNPLLKLKRIVLLDNNDLALFSPTQNISKPQHGAAFVLPTLSQTIYNEDQYQANKTNIDAASLGMIELDQDYHLAPDLYNNIRSNYTGISPVNIPMTNGPLTLYEEVSGKTTQTGSGKLSLLEVKTYGFGGVQAAPSYQFYYGSNNPAYDHHKTSYFGYYNSHNTAVTQMNNPSQTRGGYTTQATAHDPLAWSLQKIKTPVGAEIEIEYEAKEYEKIGYDGGRNYAVSPRRLFRIRVMGFVPDGLEKPQIKPYDNDAIALLGDATSKKIFYNYKCATGNICNSGEIKSNDIQLSIVPIPSAQAPEWLKIANGINSSCVPCNGSINNLYYTPNDPFDGYGYLEYTFDKVYGGGTRVKRITLKDPESNDAYSSKFTYYGGIATTEPDRFAPDSDLNILKKSRHGQDRHALAPAVGYDRVEVTPERNAGSVGRTEYTFSNYSEPFYPTTVGTVVLTGQFFRAYEVTSIVNTNYNYGKLLKMQHFDREGDVVGYVINQYETDLDKMGLTEEAFFRGLEITTANIYDLNRIYSVFFKKHYTSYLKSTRSMIDGIESTIEILEVDRLTGIPTHIRKTNNGEGITEDKHTLAYTSVPVLGSKYDNSSNLNALESKEKDERYRDIGSGLLQLTSGVNRTYSTTIPKRSFSGGQFQSLTSTSYPFQEKSFVFNGLNSSAQWLKADETTLLTPQNFPLEQRGIDNIYSSRRLSLDQRFTLAKAANSNYVSFTASGFENIEDFGTTGSPNWFFDGELEAVNSIRVGTGSISPHTGTYYARIDFNSIGPRYSVKEQNESVNGELYEKGLQTGRVYRASVWMHNSNDPSTKIVVNLDGSTGSGTYNTSFTANLSQAVETIGDWSLVQLTFAVPEDYVSSGGNNNQLQVYIENPSSTTYAKVDDFRFHPLDAVVESYIYDQKKNLMLYQLDKESFYTRLEYDHVGRPTKTFIEAHPAEKMVSEQEYGFARPVQ